MKAILIVAIIAVENGWIVNADKVEMPMSTLAACHAKRAEVAKRLSAEKGTQFYAICKPIGDPA